MSGSCRARVEDTALEASVAAAVKQSNTAHAFAVMLYSSGVHKHRLVLQNLQQLLLG